MNGLYGYVEIKLKSFFCKVSLCTQCILFLYFKGVELPNTSFSKHLEYQGSLSQRHDEVVVDALAFSLSQSLVHTCRKNRG